MKLIHRLSIGVFVITAFSMSAFSQSAAAGHVRLIMRTNSSFDQFTNSPTASFISWLNNKFDRTQVSSPYFDSRTSWYHNAWAYEDLYGVSIYDQLAKDHPEWILRDSKGNELYIPWGCWGSACPNYAFDPGNSDFRNWWVQNRGRNILNKGYKGLWIDDVNLEFRVGDGSGNQVAPIDPRTGNQMSYDAWKGYVAGFTQYIRQQLPNAELLHNTIWYAGGSNRDYDPNVIKEIQSADYINCERGVSDDGLKEGDPRWSVEALFKFIDHVHNLGKHVVFDEYTYNGEYGLAGYFLITDGTDGFGNQQINPNNWNGAYDVQLGTPSGGRYQWNGLWRRDFSNGMVLLNPKGADWKSVSLPGPFRRISGSTVTSLSLEQGQGAVLVGSSASNYSSTSLQTLRIDSAGPGITNFSNDAYRSGGRDDYFASQVDMSGVSSPAPLYVYQTKATSSGQITYNIPNLDSGHTYTVRLHFADDYSRSAGQRQFNVDINGNRVLSNFDVFAAAGNRMLKAVAKDFSVKPDDGGTITLVFSAGNSGNALINGIEVLP